MMQAVRFHGKRDIRLEQVPVPVCGNGQVKVGKIAVRSQDYALSKNQVKPAFVGICGSGRCIAFEVGRKN